jgi:hypothetical protein
MAADPSPVPLELLQRTLTGKRLPGADLAIADYENAIATRALRGESADQELAHSIWFIVCSLRGMGVSVNELCDLAHAGPHDTLLYGEVTIEQQLPLRVGESYRAEAVISDVGRSTLRDGSTLDKVTVLVELFRADVRHGTISSTYLFKRGEAR